MRQGEMQRDWDSEAKRARAANRIAFAVTLALAFAVCLGFLLSGASCRFSREKWMRAPQKRTRIVSDLLRRCDPTGMTTEEVKQLLGSGRERILADGSLVLRYPLGVDPIFVPNGDAVLDILFHSGRAVRCTVLKE